MKYAPGWTKGGGDGGEAMDEEFGLEMRTRKNMDREE
jgi:hypothetical protein